MALEVEAHDLVDHVKELIMQQTGFPTDQQRLIFEGRQLVGSHMLCDYNIQRERTLNLMLHLRGD